MRGHFDLAASSPLLGSALDTEFSPSAISTATMSLFASFSNIDLSVDHINLSENPANPAQASQMCGALQGQHAQVGAVLSSAMNAIKVAQNEIIAATKAAGHDPAAVFGVAQGQASTGGLLLEAGMGQGSYASFNKALSGASVAADLAADRKGSSPHEVMAEIVDTVRVTQHDSSAQQVSFFPGQDNGTDAKGGQTNFARMIATQPDAGKAMKAIMAVDTDNPDFSSLAENFPEIAELLQTQMLIEAKMEELAAFEKKFGEPPYCAHGVNAMGELPPAQVIVANGGADMPHVTAFDHTGAAVVLGGKPAAGNSLETAAMKQSLAANFDSAPAMQDTMGA